MKLEHFQLRGFAQHEALDLSFKDGEPNLIIGPNEAGKSHLMTALTGTVFGIADPERYTPWHGEPVMTGRLWFRSAEDQIEIERHFLEHHVEVTVNGENVYSGRGLASRNTAEDERYRSLWHQWIGFTDHDVFKRTVFVGQDQIQDRGLGSFAAQFKRLISGTREANYETAIEDLEAKLDTLIKLPGKRANRRRETLLDQLHNLESRSQKAEQVQRQVVALAEEEREKLEASQTALATAERYETLIERYGELQQHIASENQRRLAWYDLQDQLKRLQRIVEQRKEQESRRDLLRVQGDPEPGEIHDLGRDLERLESRIEHLSEAAERNQELRQNREFLESELERLRIPGNVEASAVREIGTRLQHTEETINERQQALDETMREAAIEWQRTTPLQHALFVFAGLMFIGSVALGILIDLQLLAGIAIAGALVASGVIAGRRLNRPPPPDDPYVQKIKQRRQELQEAVDTLKSYQGERNKLLSASKVQTLHELFDRAREYHGTEMRLEALPEVDEGPEMELPKAQADFKERQDRRNDLLRRSGEHDLDALHQRATEYHETVRFLDQMEIVEPEEIVSVAERLDKAQQETVISRRAKQLVLRDYPELNDVEPEQVGEFREKIEHAQRKQKKADQRLYEIKVEREHLGRGSEDAEELRLQVNLVREEIKQVELQAEANQLAVQVLQESVHDFQERALDPVAERAGSHMTSLTEGRYQQVTLDRSTMAPAVNSNGNTNIPLDQLSRGTRDQLYLSIRAALIDALSGDRNLPMLLDDPCVNFDEDRLANAAYMLQELARERQVLLFTKDETWTRWFDPALRLER